MAGKSDIIPCEHRLGEDVCLQWLLVELQRRCAFKGSQGSCRGGLIARALGGCVLARAPGGVGA